MSKLLPHQKMAIIVQRRAEEAAAAKASPRRNAHRKSEKSDGTRTARISWYIEINLPALNLIGTIERYTGQTAGVGDKYLEIKLPNGEYLEASVDGGKKGWMKRVSIALGMPDRDETLVTTHEFAELVREHVEASPQGGTAILHYAA
ncbi:hypothetical protein [Hoeflea sp. AS16]|uniref:hypothetical protein n=1 Tax=Hoeflea sp. AS16 TaxID=3135779 RepID=UPI00316E268C